MCLVMHVAYVGKLAKIFFVFLGELCEAVARDRVHTLKHLQKNFSTNFSSSWENWDSSPKNIACWLEKI